jgi:hypothetical protein
MSKNIEELIAKTRKTYKNKKDCKEADVPLTSRYFGDRKTEVNEPLIKHPCNHGIGAWK